MALTRPELEDLLVDYLYDELEPRRRLRFEEDVGRVPELQAEVDAHLGFRRSLANLDPGPAPPQRALDAIMREARKVAAEHAAAKPSLFERVASWLMQPAVATACVVVVVAGGGWLVSRGGLSDRPSASLNAPHEQGSGAHLEAEKKVAPGAEVARPAEAITPNEPKGDQPKAGELNGPAGDRDAPSPEPEPAAVAAPAAAAAATTETQEGRGQLDNDEAAAGSASGRSRGEDKPTDAYRAKPKRREASKNKKTVDYEKPESRTSGKAKELEAAKKHGVAGGTGGPPGPKVPAANDTDPNEAVDRATTHPNLGDGAALATPKDVATGRALLDTFDAQLRKGDLDAAKRTLAKLASQRGVSKVALDEAEQRLADQQAAARKAAKKSPRKLQKKQAAPAAFQ